MRTTIKVDGVSKYTVNLLAKHLAKKNIPFDMMKDGRGIVWTKEEKSCIAQAHTEEKIYTGKESGRNLSRPVERRKKSAIARKRVQVSLQKKVEI